MAVEEKFVMKPRSSSAAALYGNLINNDFPNAETRSLATNMYAAKNKRRAIYDVMLHYKDIFPHKVDFMFPGEARAEFEAWLDASEPKNTSL